MTFIQYMYALWTLKVGNNCMHIHVYDIDPKELNSWIKRFMNIILISAIAVIYTSNHTL